LRELSLHLLDIVENSVAAKAGCIEISVIEDRTQDRLKLSVKDDGVGMTPEMAARVTDPFVTSRTTRKVGLGIPLLKAAAEACNGYLSIHSVLREGTRVDVEFQHSHIDRMPLGNLTGTFLNLLVSYPHIRWVLTVQVNEELFVFDSAPIIRELEGIPLTEPTILSFLRQMLEEGIESVHLAG